MTWEQRILAAWRGVEKAQEERAKVLTEAREAGLTLSTIGDLVGVAPSTVMRNSEGGPPQREDQGTLLKAPAE